MGEAQPGDYVLATKYSDGDPQDHWVVGWYKGILPKLGGDRYDVVDGLGNSFRGNGFRRIKKISPERGGFLLGNIPDIRISDKSLWWWVRKKIQ